MAWGDVWGSSPSEYHRKLAKAFFEGREFGTEKKAKVERMWNHWWFFSYSVRGQEIARFTPASMMPEIIAAKLTGELENKPITYPEMAVRPYFCDKAEMRHLKALGVDAEWQCSGRPFLICGASCEGHGWKTLKEWAALPKWEEPKKEPRRVRERFVNMTLPLEFS